MCIYIYFLLLLILMAFVRQKEGVLSFVSIVLAFEWLVLFMINVSTYVLNILQV